MTMQQPEALRLADRLSNGYSNLRSDLEPAAAELRRLHARVQELEAQRNPLSLQKIRQIDAHAGLDAIDFARAIEHEHGIIVQTIYHEDNERDHSDEDAAIAAGKVQAALKRSQYE